MVTFARQDLASATKTARRVLLDLFYPPRCVGCGRFDGGFLCDRCLDAAVRPVGVGFCANCSAPWDGRDFCSECIHWDALDGGRAAFSHARAPRQAVHALKYLRVRAVAESMAPPIREVASSFAPDLVMAIPLHRSRVKRRGYNQAEELLRAAGLATGEGELRRLRKTRTQVGLGLANRRANVGGAFTYTGPPLDGKRVVLIDDVVTTGSTANECARVLKDYGARHVYVASFTRASSLGGDA